MRSVDILARCPLFAQLEAAELAAFANVVTTRHYSQGQMLFLASEEPESLHVVVAGVVKIFVLSPQSGREIILTSEPPYNTGASLQHRS